LTTSDEAFVFARSDEGNARLVGRYRTIRQGSAGRVGEFGYVGSWLKSSSAFPLDPTNLPLSNETFQTLKRGFLFGPLADATPDRWGRNLIHLSHPAKLFTPVDWLHAAGHDRVGCLEFSATTVLSPKRLERLGMGSLDAIAAEFKKIDQGLPAAPEAKRIYDAGSSVGGARPKAIIEADNALWIAKFEKLADTFDECAVEHATMTLVRACGINAAETKLVDVGSRKAVLVKRFDRTAGPHFHPTAHYLSAMSLLNVDETSPDGSYYAIAAEILRHGSRPHHDRVELFRRMVFNVLCGNRDDHLKNHALLRSAGGWHLSPAFDVLPQPDIDPSQAIAVGRIGTYPSVENCLSRCGDFGLRDDEARAEINRIATVMSRWRTVFEENGVPETDLSRVASAFAVADSVGESPGVKSLST
jgi:serine/threonine-protein kinase HipA